MARLMKILAASVGSGLALGYGVRALANTKPHRRDLPKDSGYGRGKLQDALLRMEERLDRLEGPVESTTSALPIASEESATNSAQSMRTEAVSAVQKIVADSIDQRIEKLEAAVVSHSVAMQDLRECSLVTERNMQRLLAGIDRLVSSQDRVSTSPPAERPGLPARATQRVTQSA